MAQQSRISVAQLEEMFANIRAKTPWDIDGPMLWGYFFTGADGEALEDIGAQLEDRGYGFVGIRELEGDPPDEAMEWQLHVERVEAHTVESLDKRNLQFENLAGQYDNVVYDGMDVGPAK